MKPTKLKSATFLGMLSLASAVSAQTTSPSPDPKKTDEEVVKLPMFSVTSSVDNPYAANEVMSAARIKTSLDETPATINVITLDFMRDVGANSILDASRYFSGISAGRIAGTNGILDRQLIRGFENSGRTIDNISTSYQAQVNPEMIERVEIVKGPNAILSPTGAPGGSLNVITKDPSFTQKNSAILELGSFASNKATVDLTGPLGGGVAYRLVASYLDADSYVTSGKLVARDINPSVIFKAGKNTTIKIKASDVDWRAKGNAAVPSFISASPLIPNNGYVTPDTMAPGFTYNDTKIQPSWALRKDLVSAITAEGVTAIGEHVNMRIAAATNVEKFMEDDTFISYGNSGNSFYDPYTGIYTPLLTWSKNGSGVYTPTVAAWTDPKAVPQYGDLTVTKYHDTMIQNDFAGNWRFDDISISPVVGWMYQDRHGDNWERQIFESNIDITNSSRSDVVHHARSDYDLLDTDLTESKKLTQFYGYMQASMLKRRLFLSGGLSRISVDNWSIDHNSSDDKSTLKGSHDTYMAGALYKPVSNISVYYSYSSNAQATDAGRGAPPRWRDGKQHEVGVKASAADDRLSFTVSHFRISQNNISTPNPLRALDPSQPSVLFQDQKNDGLEFEVSGGITKDLSIVASYTKQKLRDTLGRRVRNVPDEMANALLNYHFTKELSMFVGVQRTGDTAAETAPGSLTDLGVVKQVSLYVPEFTVVNAGASYAWKHVRVGLNVDNLLDKKALYQASGRGAFAALAGMNIRGTIRYEF